MKLRLYAPDELPDKLAGKNLKEVERATGISYPTVYALARGVDKDYRIKTLIAMTEWINLEAVITEVMEEQNGK